MILFCLGYSGLQFTTSKHIQTHPWINTPLICRTMQALQYLVPSKAVFHPHHWLRLRTRFIWRCFRLHMNHCRSIHPFHSRYLQVQWVFRPWGLTKSPSSSTDDSRSMPRIIQVEGNVAMRGEPLVDTSKITETFLWLIISVVQSEEMRVLQLVLVLQCIIISRSFALVATTWKPPQQEYRPVKFFF